MRTRVATASLSVLALVTLAGCCRSTSGRRGLAREWAREAVCGGGRGSGAQEWLDDAVHGDGRTSIATEWWRRVISGECD